MRRPRRRPPQLACLLEASAPKPGNVSPGRHFADVRYEDFLASAAAIGAPSPAPATRPLGDDGSAAVEATSRWTRSNTNLGIVLLLAPLARAALPSRRATLRARRCDEVLATHDRSHDARDVYAAIRLASPGGLGGAADRTSHDEPTVTLLERCAWRPSVTASRASTRPRSTSTFETAVPALLRARARRLSWDDAMVETFLTLLAARPTPTWPAAAGLSWPPTVSQRAARRCLRAGGVRSDDGRSAIGYIDHSLRDPRNTGNPGTTADLTAAAIFVVLLGRRSLEVQCEQRVNSA